MGVIMPLTEEEKVKRKRAYTAQWRKDNADKIKAQASSYFKKHKVRLLKQNKDWKAANPDLMKDYHRKYYQENKGHYRTLYNKYNKELTDSSVKRRISDRSTLKFKDIPQSLVRAKRAYIKGIRLIKEQENEG
jgi:hypothetical protein